MEQFRFLERIFDLPGLPKDSDKLKRLDELLRFDDQERAQWGKYASEFHDIDRSNPFKCAAFWKDVNDNVQANFEKLKSENNITRIALPYCAYKKYGLVLGGLASYHMSDVEPLLHSDTCLLSAQQFSKAEEIFGYFGNLSMRLSEAVGLAGDYRVEAGLAGEGKYLQDMSVRYINHLFKNRLEVKTTFFPGQEFKKNLSEAVKQDLKLHNVSLYIQKKAEGQKQ